MYNLCKHEVAHLVYAKTSSFAVNLACTFGICLGLAKFAYASACTIGICVGLAILSVPESMPEYAHLAFAWAWPL